MYEFNIQVQGRTQHATMSFLTTFAAHLRDYRLCVRLLNSLRTSSCFELAARTPNLYPVAPPCVRWSATSTAALASTAESASEESLPVSAESAAVSSVSGESVNEVVDDVVPKTLEATKWNTLSRRTGLVAIKLGMTQLWNKQGVPIAVTVLQVRLSLSIALSLSLSQAPSPSLPPPSLLSLHNLKLLLYLRKNQV